MGQGRKAAILVGQAALIAALAACGGGSSSKLALDGVPPEQIYQIGQRTLTVDRDPKKAVTIFAEIERQYPYTIWARRALIQEAVSQHRARKFDDARTTAQRYIDTYPGDEDAAYAKYIIALTYYDQIDDVGRDQKMTYDALQALRAVIQDYPDSEYAKSAILKFDLAFDHLAGKEMEVGRYYLKQGDYTAAINRFRVVVEQYQTTTQTPEALYRLIECYLSLGITDQAQTAGAILGHNFQSTVWYRDGYRVLTGQGLAPKASATGWLSEIYRQTVQGKWL